MRGVLTLALPLAVVWILPACGCGSTSLRGDADTTEEITPDTGEDPVDAGPDEPLTYCGNGVIEGDESCDGDDLGGMTCEDLGYHGGLLACRPDCTFDESRCGDTPGCVRYVDLNTTAFSPDGLTWATAVPTVQHGIDLAAEVATMAEPCEVWVAEGTYHIYQTEPADSVQLEPYVHLFGGFRGREVLRVERDWDEYKTILDGRASEDSSMQVYHVVQGSGETLIDGFEITGGRTKEDYPLPGVDSVGAGMVVWNGSPVIENCTFRDNIALSNGSGWGGAILVESGNTKIRRCAFIDNMAGRLGGAIAINSARPHITDCVFENNSVRDSDGDLDGMGGAIGTTGSMGLRIGIENCIFIRNSARHGGAIVADSCEHDGTFKVLNSTFIENHATVAGGALSFHQCVDSVNNIIANCTFYGNAARDGSIIYLDAHIYDGSGTFISISNSAIWDNSVPLVWINDTYAGRYDITYSCGEMDPGPGTVGADPMFADPDRGDFHLQSGSPCIDAADGEAAPEHDIEGYLRYDDPSTPNTGTGLPSYADMGAYEYRP
jgi:hypothetical protein